LALIVFKLLFVLTLIADEIMLVLALIVFELVLVLTLIADKIVPLFGIDS